MNKGIVLCKSGSEYFVWHLTSRCARWCYRADSDKAFHHSEI